ncbi:hypothetical protein K501DRAFT_192749 [Backusella circina FSU 941]|nr:hypothetical protein K501DRAFT_192749 [Backusella circina FSU 941]
MEIFHSLERHCYGDACYCDLRLSIYDCVGSNVARVVNIINIALSALLTVVGFTLVYHRIVIKGYTFIDSNPKKGLLRPKPIDCMLLFITIFNSIRLVCSIILVLDVAADNMTFRSFIYEWGFQWGLTGFTLYLIGIAQTLAESHKAISDSWLPSPFIVDAIGISIIFASHVGNTILAVGAGIMARSNIKAAEIFVQVNYIVWFVLTASVAFSVLYCGSRLLKTLKSHIKRFNTSNERYLNIKNGIFKIRVMMGLIVFCLLAFSVSVFVYGILRNTVIKNYIGSVILCVSWNMLGPLTVVFIQVSIIFK